MSRPASHIKQKLRRNLLQILNLYRPLLAYRLAFANRLSYLLFTYLQEPAPFPLSNTPRNRLPDKDIHIPRHRRIRVFRHPRAFLRKEFVQEPRQQARRDRLLLLFVFIVFVVFDLFCLRIPCIF